MQYKHTESRHLPCASHRTHFTVKAPTTHSPDARDVGRRDVILSYRHDVMTRMNPNGLWHERHTRRTIAQATSIRACMPGVNRAIGGS